MIKIIPEEVLRIGLEQEDVEAMAKMVALRDRIKNEYTGKLREDYGIKRPAWKTDVDPLADIKALQEKIKNQTVTLESVDKNGFTVNVTENQKMIDSYLAQIASTGVLEGPREFSSRSVAEFTGNREKLWGLPQNVISAGDEYEEFKRWKAERKKEQEQKAVAPLEKPLRLIEVE